MKRTRDPSPPFPALARGFPGTRPCSRRGVLARPPSLHCSHLFPLPFVPSLFLRFFFSLFLRCLSLAGVFLVSFFFLFSVLAVGLTPAPKNKRKERARVRQAGFLGCRLNAHSFFSRAWESGVLSPWAALLSPARHRLSEMRVILVLL